MYRRFIALLFAAGFFMLAFDVAVGHFADQTVEHKAQLPGTIAPLLCALLLIAAAFLNENQPWFRRLTRVSGGMSILAGAVGTSLHTARFVSELAGESTWEAILETLTVTPPLLAPLAFVGLGAVLVVFASGRWKLINATQEAQQTTSAEAA